RCPPKQVVDVLQAIHLLLAFELFVVVVGVDARWIRHALRERYPKMLSEDWSNGNAPKKGKERQDKFATPRDYIEKIFQVPFWLRPMDDSAAQKLLEGLIPVSQISSGVEPDRNLPRADAAAAKATEATKSGAISAVGEQDLAESTTTMETLDGVDQETQANEKVAAAASGAGALVEQFELKPESLLLDIDERNTIVGLSRVIGKTPRTLKRFVNVYRIIKAQLNGKELEAFVGTGPSDAQYRAVLILLAVAYGAPDVAASFFRALKNGKKEMGLKEFLNLTYPSTFQPDWFVIEELNKFVNEYKVDIRVGVLCEWLPVVVRYTFQHGSLSEEVANRQARIVQERT
ncbi:MAG TPA: P-loop NTPase fold protein, partial [Pyrinomonadaceae bacterium]